MLEKQIIKNSFKNFSQNLVFRRFKKLKTFTLKMDKLTWRASPHEAIKLSAAKLLVAAVQQNMHAEAAASCKKHIVGF